MIDFVLFVCLTLVVVWLCDTCLFICLRNSDLFVGYCFAILR